MVKVNKYKFWARVVRAATHKLQLSSCRRTSDVENRETALRPSCWHTFKFRYNGPGQHTQIHTHTLTPSHVVDIFLKIYDIENILATSPLRGPHLIKSSRHLNATVKMS